METFSVTTRRRTHFVDITAEVQAAVGRLGVKDGVVTVFAPHATIRSQDNWFQGAD